jgi:hypothetical protein
MDDSELDGPKGELLHLLERVRDRMGLTEPVIRALVEQSEITYPGSRLPLLTCTQRTQHVRFMVQGVVKVVCEVPRFGRVIVDLVGKGRFVCLPPTKAPDPWYRIEVAVHEGPIVMALIPQNLVASLIPRLPGSNAARLVSSNWRAVWRLLFAKIALLPLPTTERLIRELARLGRHFGRSQDDRWTLIQVHLRQDDLASLIVRSRANVNRAFRDLRAEGLVDRVGHRILIASSVLHDGPVGPRGSRPILRRAITARTPSNE